MIGTIKVADVLLLRCREYKDLPDATVADVLARKRAFDEDEYADLVDSVRRHGIESPILIREEELCNGHHRVAACVDLGIEEIPFTDDPEIGWANEFEWPEEKEVACSD